jgi:hypothetical protein
VKNWNGELIFAGALLLVAITRIVPVQYRLSTSFAGYWVVARELMAGTPVVWLYNDAFLASRMDFHGVPLPETFLGPPTLTLTLLPLASFSYTTARMLWLWLVCFPSLAISFFLLRQEAGRWGSYLAALLLLSPAVASGLEVGQIYGVMLALHLLVLWALQQERHGWLAVGVVPMLVMRGWYGLLFLVLWVIQGKKRAVIGVILGSIGVVLATLPWLGAESWKHFLFVQLPGISDNPWAGTPAFQTIPSLCLHLTTFSPLWGPDPPMASIWLLPLRGGISLLVLGLLGWASRKADPSSMVALVTAAELSLAPFAQEYHYVLAALPAMVAAGRIQDRTDYYLVGAGILLIVLPWDLQASELQGGWRSLAAYPRLFGLFLISGSLLRGIWHRSLPAKPKPTSTSCTTGIGNRNHSTPEFHCQSRSQLDCEKSTNP